MGGGEDDRGIEVGQGEGCGCSIYGWIESLDLQRSLIRAASKATGSETGATTELVEPRSIGAFHAFRPL
jgi:hypothetical protein